MTGRVIACVILMTLLSSIAARSETAERRLALVVGVGAYQFAPALPNPPNDARAMGDALANLGFEVYRLIDPDKRMLETTLRDFGAKASDADIAVVFFAGHGVQVNGQNYLVPADAELKNARDLPYDTVSLSLFLNTLTDVRKAGVMIVDACRNNPFVERLSARADPTMEVRSGLSRIDDAPSGTIIAMATRANSVAEDGVGIHSPYTDALLKELDQPGVELRLFFGRVADRVKAATKSRQEPYVAGDIGGTPIFLNPLPPNHDPVIGEAVELKVLDSAGATPLMIPRPMDPDQTDRLVVQVTGLPRGGQVKVFDRVVLIGDYLTPEQLTVAAFDPDGTVIGDAGSFDYTVSDSKGGSAHGSTTISIGPSNKPPVVAATGSARAVRNPLGIEPPVDPDGDPLSITVMSVPTKGKVHDGATVVAKGDHLDPAALSRLTYDPEDAPLGSAGQFAYKADDGRGGSVTSTVEIEVIEAAPAPSTPAKVAETTTAPPSGSGTAGNLEPMSARSVAVTDANLRDAPSPSAKRIDRVAKGSEVQVQGKVSGSNWYSVVTEKGIQGFIAGDLLQVVEPLPQTAMQSRTPSIGSTDQTTGSQETTRSTQPIGAASPSAGNQAAPSTENPEEIATLPLPISPSTANKGSAGLATAFADCPECPLMVRIPAGEFLMGNDKGDSSEGPVHRVTINQFVLGQYEITVAQWKSCVAAKRCDAISQIATSPDATPMHNVSWDDAAAYVEWLSERTGKHYRLPSEAEWEYAARAGTGAAYWWGEGESAQYASCKDCGGTFVKLAPPSAAALMPNPFGLVGMNGGVSEWVADCWKPTYGGAPKDGSARALGNCSNRVLRGGSWRNDHKHITATMRGFYDHDVRYLDNGFRVARDLY